MSEKICETSCKTTSQTVFEKPAEAKRIPSKREFHGDTYVDEYAWMKNRSSSELLEYINSQNAYTAKRVKHLENLRSTLFNELRSRVQETDMSVPVRMNNYWYYVRTQEGKQYAIQCRMKVSDEANWNPPTIDGSAEPGVTLGEEILFDANKEAELAGSKFFRLGGMDLSSDGSRMLYELILKATNVLAILCAIFLPAHALGRLWKSLGRIFRLLHFLRTENGCFM